MNVFLNLSLEDSDKIRPWSKWFSQIFQLYMQNTLKHILPNEQQSYISNTGVTKSF